MFHMSNPPQDLSHYCLLALFEHFILSGLWLVTPWKHRQGLIQCLQRGRFGLLSALFLTHYTGALVVFITPLKSACD